VKSGLLLNVVVREGSSVLQLLARKDESLGGISLSWICFTFSKASGLSTSKVMVFPRMSEKLESPDLMVWRLEERINVRQEKKTFGQSDHKE